MEGSPNEKLSAKSGLKVIPSSSSSSSKPKSLNNGKGNKKESTKVKKTSSTRKIDVISENNGNSGDGSPPDGYFKVKAIVGKRVVGGVVQYFVEWEGWESESNTWEPIKHLKYCQEKVDAYENKLATSRQEKTSDTNRKSVKRSSCSVASSSGIVASPSLKKTNTSPAKSKTQERKCNLTRNKAVVVEQVSTSDEELSSEVEDDDEDESNSFEVLSKYPPGKEIERIHAVAAVSGYLTFLVQWKTSESLPQDNQQLPPLSEKNCNMVRAMSLNEGFPQDVIRFYEQRIRFFVDMESIETEVGKIARVREQAEERKHAAALEKKTSTLTSAATGEESDTEDPATKAIEKSERKYDKFDPFDSEEMSSSSSDELQSPDEDQEIQD